MTAALAATYAATYAATNGNASAVAGGGYRDGHRAAKTVYVEILAPGRRDNPGAGWLSTEYRTTRLPLAGAGPPPIGRPGWSRTPIGPSRASPDGTNLFDRSGIIERP